MYYLLHYKSVPTVKNRELNFFKTVENFGISQKDLEDIHLQSSRNYDHNTSIDGTFSTSELTLMMGLLEPIPSERLSVTDACVHQWFINQRSKNHLGKKDGFLPSLKTIIELGE